VIACVAGQVNELRQVRRWTVNYRSMIAAWQLPLKPAGRPAGQRADWSCLRPVNVSLTSLVCLLAGERYLGELCRWSNCPAAQRRLCMVS